MDKIHFDSKESVIDVKNLDFWIFSGRETELKRAPRRLSLGSQGLKVRAMRCK